MAPARGGRRTPQHAARGCRLPGRGAATPRLQAATTRLQAASARPSLPPPSAHERNSCQVITGYPSPALTLTLPLTDAR